MILPGGMIFPKTHKMGLRMARTHFLREGTMKQKGLWGFLFVAALGTVLHFLYEWSGESTLAALVSGVNESVWEHMKLLFVPVFLWLVLTGDDWAAGAVSLLAGLAFIPAAYYAYTGALGLRVAAVDIALFYLAAALTFWLRRHLEGKWEGRWQQAAGLVVLTVLALAFLVWTFYPPRFPLWQDPVSGSFGLLSSETLRGDWLSFSLLR